MLLRETQDPQAQAPLAVQIYATDLNPSAIAVARKGWYSAQALADLSSTRRERFFTAHEGGFTVHPDIRAMVMFARHDVIVDPPFTQLDLLLCRNVLIYFNATLQRRLMPLFHFSLRAGGKRRDRGPLTKPVQHFGAPLAHLQTHCANPGAWLGGVPRSSACACAHPPSGIECDLTHIPHFTRIGRHPQPANPG
jgi:hypothetical protein